MRRTHRTTRTTLAGTKRRKHRGPALRAGFFLCNCNRITTVQLHLDPTVYALEAVQKAAYRFIDRLTILISQDGGQIVCNIDLVPEITIPLEAIVDDFKRELLDQQLRLKIKAETTDVRNLILSYAFSRTGLQG